MILAAVLAALTTAHLQVSTSDPQAQSSFDRGLYLYYAYDRGAAERAFKDAASRDPRLAMAYWGQALADGPDLNTAMTAERFDAGRAAIERAVTFAPTASSLERALIGAMALRYNGRWSDWKRDDDAYRTAMSDVAKTSSDPNARLLTAEALLERGEAPDVLALLNDVLERNPRDAMANHLCIHAYEYETDRKPALVCAQRLDAATFSPEAEHLAHMPAHFWIETGAYAEAVASSQRAYDLIVQLERGGLDPEHVTQYAGHDLSVGYGAVMMLGSYARAKAWSVRMTARFDAGFDALTALRFGRYDVAARADSTQLSDVPIRGLALLHLGRIAEARSLSAQIRAIAGLSNPGYFPQLFMARLAELDGNDTEVRIWLAQATDNQHAVFSSEMLPLIPAEEATGGYLLRRKAYADAAAAFDTCLRTYPNDPRALFGLATALEALGRHDEALRMHAQFDAIWHGADTTLTVDDL